MKFLEGVGLAYHRNGNLEHDWRLYCFI